MSPFNPTLHSVAFLSPSRGSDPQLHKPLLQAPQPQSSCSHPPPSSLWVAAASRIDLWLSSRVLFPLFQSSTTCEVHSPVNPLPRMPTVTCFPGCTPTEVAGERPTKMAFESVWLCPWSWTQYVPLSLEGSTLVFLGMQGDYLTHEVITCVAWDEVPSKHFLLLATICSCICSVIHCLQAPWVPGQGHFPSAEHRTWHIVGECFQMD